MGILSILFMRVFTLSRPKSRLATWLLFALWLLSGISPCPAQISPITPPTLWDALNRAALPSKTVVLSVDAQKIALPQNAVLPGTQPTVIDVSGIYGRVAQRFGSVLAVAPPTMIVLNSAPGEPNIYKNMSPLEAFTLLAASLNDSQWHALTSEAGLGIGDLHSAQQQMFAAMLSHDGKLLVMPQYAEGETWNDKDQRDLTDQLTQAHLRLGQTVTFSLSPKDQPETSYGDAAIPPESGAPRQYEIAERQDYGGSSDTVYGAVVRAELPNVPKRGQLNFALPALQAAISLNGLKTVGDLVYRIGSSTHTELYVDPHLEKKTLTLTGLPVAPAADLLRALAFCLTGTFRQVGPAYVLTDDIVGIGTRRQIWAEFEEEADSLRLGPVTTAENALYTSHSPRDLPWFDASGTYTPAEIKSAGLQSINTQDGFLPELKLQFSQLTPSQQDMVERGVEKWNREYTLQPVTADGATTLRPGLSVQLLVPCLSTPVDMNLNHGPVEQYFVFQMPDDMAQARRQASNEQQLKEHPEWAKALTQMSTQAPLTDVWASLKLVPRRAAIIHPRTSKDVDAEIVAAKMLGLNELWLDVFSDGAAHIPGLTFSPAKPLDPRENDILTEALTRTKGTPIRIFPLVDLLFWGQTPPPQDADLNILGETSAQAATRWQEKKDLLPKGQKMSEEFMSNAIIPDWPGVAVCPLALGVWTTLSQLLKITTTHSEIAGLVWRGLDTPGYDTLPGGSDTSSLLLGYQVDARLGFLRRFHADPVDIYDIGHSGTLANTDLPNFSEGSSDQETYRLHDAWVKFRQDADLAFLRMLYATVNPTGTAPARRVRILVKQRRQGQARSDRPGQTSFSPGWYGSWDDPLHLPPTLHTMGEDDIPGQPMQAFPDEATQARTQSQIVVMPLTREMLDKMRDGFSLQKPLLSGGRSTRLNPQLPGFVLDLGGALAATSQGDKDPLATEDPLIALAAQVITIPSTHPTKPTVP